MPSDLSDSSVHTGAEPTCRALVSSGADASCLHTIREHWANEGKLIVVLSDDHIERMLGAKEAGGPPKDVLRQWIEDFRLAI